MKKLLKGATGAKGWAIFAMIAIIVLLLLTVGGKPGRLTADDSGLKSVDRPARTDTSREPTISQTKISSKNGILVDLTANQILWEKESRKKAYPASLTKMMTAMVVIDNTTDFSRKVKVDARTIHQAALKEASVAGFLPNEEVTLLDLLYGMMLPSGAEASSALARSIAGSEAEFVRMMNDEADRLGMKHTHFANASGLHDADHYTTAEDLSLLLNYALNNETFRQIFTTQKHTTEPTNLHPEGYTLLSTLFTKIDDNRLEGGRLIGGKTGYTSEAGLCLASLAKKDGHEYILITMGATGDHRSAQAPIQDAFTIYNTFTS